MITAKQLSRELGGTVEEAAEFLKIYKWEKHGTRTQSKKLLEGSKAPLATR